MIPPFIFLLIALISGAGASFTYIAYRKTDATELPPPPDDLFLLDNCQDKTLKKTIEEAIQPHLEKTAELNHQLAEKETKIKDLQVALSLAPEPKLPEVPDQETEENKTEKVT
jgi:hypothetical protein